VPAYVGGRAGISSAGDWLAADGLCGECGAQMLGDELAVEASVFDEDLVGSLSGDDDSGEVDSWHVAFERGGVADGAARVGLVQGDTEALDETEVGVIAGEGEDEVIWQGEFALGSGEGDGVFGDADDAGVEVRVDFAVLDAVVDVGEDPVFDVAVHLGAAVDEGDFRSVTP